MLVVSKRSFLKSLASYVLFFTTIAIILPVFAYADDSSKPSKSPEELLSRMKERLNLSEDQATKVQPIIEESYKKRNEIEQNSALDKNSVKSALWQLQWSTDMKLGMILTEKQMDDYQKMREAQSDASQRNDAQRSKGTRTGGLNGF